jgi:hypothetical protein
MGSAQGSMRRHIRPKIINRGETMMLRHTWTNEKQGNARPPGKVFDSWFLAHVPHVSIGSMGPGEDVAYLGS